MSKRWASSRVLGSFCPVFRSLLTIPRRIWVTSCSRIGTSLFLEIQIRMRNSFRQFGPKLVGEVRTQILQNLKLGSCRPLVSGLEIQQSESIVAFGVIGFATDGFLIRR